MKRDWTPAVEKVSEEGQCRYCGSSGPLDPAHIIPRSRGGDMDSRGIVPLCRVCHSVYDGGGLELLSVLTLEEQAFAVGRVGVAEVYRRTTVRIAA